MPGNMPPAGSKVSPSSQHPPSGPHDYGTFTQELIKCLLEVWKVIHVSWGKVISDEVCPLYSSDNFTTRHVRYLEDCGINVASLQSLSRNHFYHAQQQESVDKNLWTERASVRA